MSLSRCDILACDFLHILIIYYRQEQMLSPVSSFGERLHRVLPPVQARLRGLFENKIVDQAGFAEENGQGKQSLP